MFKESVEQTLMLISQAVAQIEIAERLKVRVSTMSVENGRWFADIWTEDIPLGGLWEKPVSVQNGEAVWQHTQDRRGER